LLGRPGFSKKSGLSESLLLTLLKNVVRGRGKRVEKPCHRDGREGRSQGGGEEKRQKTMKIVSERSNPRENKTWSPEIEKETYVED